MVSVTLLLPVSISDRSEKNTSCLMFSAARSPLIMSIIMAMDLVRTIGSQALSGIAMSLSPCSAASACPTGTR